MVHFVGAGPGAADLITVRGKNYLEQADVIIYAGSLVNPQLLGYAKDTCEICTQVSPVFMVRCGNRWMPWTRGRFPMTAVPESVPVSEQQRL